MTPEDLAREALCAIPLDRRPQFPRGGYTQSRRGPAIGHDEQRHETRVNAKSARVCAFEIGPAADPLGGCESAPLAHPSALVGHRETLAALCAAPLQHDPAVFRGHPHTKTVSFLPSSYVGLKCTLSLHAVFASWTPASSKSLEPVPKSPLPSEETPIVVAAKRAVKGSAARRTALCYSRGRSSQEVVWKVAKEASVSPPRFPQMWKTLWKT